MPERNLTEQAKTRLRRIEGQVRGIQGMLDRMSEDAGTGQKIEAKVRELLAAGKRKAAIVRELGISQEQVEAIVDGRESSDGDPCDDLLTQILAVRAAVEQVGLLVLELHLQRCALGEQPLTSEQLGDLHETLKLWSRLNPTTR